LDAGHLCIESGDANCRTPWQRMWRPQSRASEARRLLNRRGTMKRLVLALAIGAALSVAAIAQGAAPYTTARWVKYPTCSATLTSLTCTGRVAGLRPSDETHFMSLLAQTHYSCPDDPTIWGVGRFDEVQAGVEVQNGKSFSLTYSPPASPRYTNGDCPSGWIRDPSYYDVDVALIHHTTIVDLDGFVGTVSPS
jgi:hypothetical protein